MKFYQTYQVFWQDLDLYSTTENLSMGVNIFAFTTNISRDNYNHDQDHWNQEHRCCCRGASTMSVTWIVSDITFATPDTCNLSSSLQKSWILGSECRPITRFIDTNAFISWEQVSSHTLSGFSCCFWWAKRLVSSATYSKNSSGISWKKKSTGFGSEGRVSFGPVGDVNAEISMLRTCLDLWESSSSRSRFSKHSSSKSSTSLFTLREIRQRDTRCVHTRNRVPFFIETSCSWRPLAIKIVKKIVVIVRR